MNAILTLYPSLIGVVVIAFEIISVSSEEFVDKDI
jgi:hypothetical protein